MKYEIIDQAPSTAEYLLLREAVGWHRLPEQVVEKSLEGSVFNIHALTEGEVIGFGRIIGDGQMYFYMQDVIVHPKWQGNGVGFAITERRHEKVISVAHPGAFFGLMAAGGVSGLYEKFGFKRRPEGMPGMSLWVGA